MTNEIAEVVQNIQYMVTPAVMVSSAALLLLALHTKFSNLANRFRGLEIERRGLAGKETRGVTEHKRLESLERQVAYLLRRANYIQKSIILAYTAIICFAGASILIILSVVFSLKLQGLVIAVFVGGFLCILVSAIVLIIEIQLAYAILLLERRS